MNLGVDANIGITMVSLLKRIDLPGTLYDLGSFSRVLIIIQLLYSSGLGFALLLQLCLEWRTCSIPARARRVFMSKRLSAYDCLCYARLVILPYRYPREMRKY